MNKYEIVGKTYTEEPHYYDWDTSHEFPVYDQVSEEHWTIEAESLQEAVRWFKTNHPEQVQGGCVNRIDGGGTEFCMFAVPSREYGYGYFETVENRANWARMAD